MERQVQRSATIKESEIDWSRVDKNAYNTVQERFGEYRQAAEYFLKIGNRERAEKFLKYAEKFHQYKQMLVKGTKIDLLKIEPMLSP